MNSPHRLNRIQTQDNDFMFRQTGDALGQARRDDRDK